MSSSVITTQSQDLVRLPSPDDGLGSSESANSDLVIDVRRHNQGCTIQCAGALTVRGADRLAEAIDVCVEEDATKLEIDLRGVARADPAVLEVLSSKADLCLQHEIELGLTVSFGEIAYDFGINVHGSDDVRAIECSGALMAAQAARLAEAIERCLAEGVTSLDIDLQRVTYADATIFDVLTTEAEHCGEVGATLRLAVGEVARRVLNSKGFEQLTLRGIELRGTIKFYASL